MEVSAQLHAPAALPPEKDPRCPLDRGLEGFQRRPVHSGGNKYLALPRIETAVQAKYLPQLSRYIRTYIQYLEAVLEQHKDVSCPAEKITVVSTIKMLL
jgi:hypothetical protein